MRDRRGRKGKGLATVAKALVFLCLATLSVGAGALIARHLPARPAAPVIATAEPVAPASQRPDPFSSLDAATLRELVRGDTTSVETFRAVPQVPAAELCRRLADAGLVMSEWAPDPFAAAAWSCMSDLAAVAPDGSLRPAAEGGETTLFAMVRGDHAGRLESLRLKLNAFDIASAEAAGGVARAIVEDVYATFGWHLPEEAARLIGERRPFLREVSGTRLRIAAEDADPRRVNITLDTPTTLHIGGSASFDPLYGLFGALAMPEETAVPETPSP
jgi:hypothetical protein